MKTKICSKCKIEKSTIEFYHRKDSKDKLNGVCSGCIKKHRYKYRWEDKYKKSSLDYKLRKDYNITLDQYDKLFEQQKGLCAICGKPQPVKFHRLAVDHDRKTNKVRGLLCQSCNGMLGLAKDDVTTLSNAIKYLVSSVV